MCVILAVSSHVAYIARSQVLKLLLFLMEGGVNNLFVIAESFYFLQCGRLRPQSSKHNNSASV